MTPISRSLAEVLEQLTAAQLAELAAVKREREQHSPTFADEQRRLADKADPETCRRFDALEPLEGRFHRIGGLWRAMGIQDDIIGANLIRQATEAGIDQEEAEQAVVAAGIEWRPRTAHQRDLAVLADMLASGWPEDAVRRIAEEWAT